MNCLNQRGVLSKEEFCEKNNNVNDEMCDGILKECYKNSCKRDSDGLIVKTKYFFDNMKNTF